MFLIETHLTIIVRLRSKAGLASTYFHVTYFTIKLAKAYIYLKTAKKNFVEKI